MEQSPCFLLSPFLSPFVSLYLLGTLLAVIGSCPPRSQVARKLISPFPPPSPYTSHSKIPTPWGFPELNMHITKTTSRTWLTRSSTLTKAVYTFCIYKNKSCTENTTAELTCMASLPKFFSMVEGFLYYEGFSSPSCKI